MKEMDPSNVCDEAAVVVFLSQLSSRTKSLTRSAFIRLCEEGEIKGVKSGDYTSSKANKAYANDAAELLQNSPKLNTIELWVR
jgi:hypothetical protein